MKRLAEFFTDNNGQLSNIRAMSFMALVIAATLSFKGISFDVLTIWLVAAFAPKVIQKFAEKGEK